MQSNPKSKPSSIEQSYTKLNELYNNLLEKNQNDLIKIKQKQKTFNEAVQTLKQEKEDMEKKYKNDINVLILELEKSKNGLKSERKLEEAKEKDADDNIKALREQVERAKKQNKIFGQIIQQKTQRIEHLQENVRKLMDENIHLTAKNQQLMKNMKQFEQNVLQLMKQNQQLKQQSKKVSDTKIESPKKGAKQMIGFSLQTEGDYTISHNQYTELIKKFNIQIQELDHQNETKQKYNQQLKNRLKETNEQLKRFMERDKKNTILLKKKVQQIQSLQTQAQNAKKSQKHERYRLPTQQSCPKCKQYEQENKLLKQMVKSMQTMVRVRQMEAERYKNKQILSNSSINNSKVHQKSEQSQSKKNAKRERELPPIPKKN